MARTQKERPFRLKTQLGEDALLLESFQGTERVSTPYRYVLRVLSETEVDTISLLKKPVVLTITLADGKERHIHGNIMRMRLRDTGEDGLYAYEIEMGPWTWFLNLFHDCKIFQNMSALDVVKKVFQNRGFTDFRDDSTGSFPQLEFCIQYGESDFNFVSRLLEQEGIFYYFEQGADKVTMVLADSNSTLQTCPHVSEVKYMAASGEAEIENTIRSLHHDVEVHTGKYSTWDYDFEKPSTDLNGGESSQDSQTEGEFYSYSDRYLTKDDASRYSRLRIEEQEVRMVTVKGEANCAALETGFKFTLEEHFRASVNLEYLLTAITYSGKNASYRSNANLEDYSFANSFEAIPASVNFRPPKNAKKPFMRGVQTAVVVGKSGEEIWTDKYGRVRIQFFWDRDGQCDENSTGWVRVSHAWAGNNWGSFYLPRIGQEVIVAFLEGDPDQPIIVGRVYNALEMPPYTLPDEQTKSTLKSLSSKGGGGFNELRFEDKKGSEQIFVHGEKNLDIQIKNDRMETIGNDRSLHVKANKYEKIDADEHNHTAGKRVEKVDGNHIVSIGGDQGIKITGNHSLEVTGNVTGKTTGNESHEVTQNLYIKGMQVVIEAMTGLTIKVGANFITLDPSGIAISGTPMVQINSAGAALSGSPGSPVTSESPTDPTDSDDAQPGSVDSPPSPKTASVVTLNLQNVSPGTKETEQDEPDRAAPAPSGGGGMSSQAEPATFGKDSDGEAQAQALKDAAKDGTPFCEECEKAKKQQQAQSSSDGSGSEGS
ncbi:MAG: type VI secretion system tip protein VgrG [Acidobacteria bacterium]|nr:type VI secretion system tip protein VgrG [Acidobacteriota bacterium]